MRRFSMVAAWLALVVVTTTVTWQIVGAADAEVSQRPASPLNASAPETASPTTTLVPEHSSTIPTPPSSTTSTTVSPTTTTSASTATSAANASPPTTTPPTTSTTAPEAKWSTTSYDTAGGTVMIKHRPEEVVLQTATPAPGFQVEVKEAGPEEVDVEFESEDDEVEFNAEWSEGELVVEVSD